MTKRDTHTKPTIDLTIDINSEIKKNICLVSHQEMSTPKLQHEFLSIN